MIDPVAESYDRIPYESHPIADTHPDRLAAIAALFGLEPPDPARARVLELGCAAGGNIIPMAWYLPGGQYLGVELSGAQAAHGQRLVAALGLDNVEIRHADIMDVALEGEPFDYILVHGVFSWVPEFVQERIFEICARRLAPRGIAYVSYNTQPGWGVRGMVREMLLHHTRDCRNPAERLKAARELLDFLATPVDNPQPGHVWLQQEIGYLRKARDSYLYHEYLEDSNRPMLFSAFMDRAHAAGLQYVGDTQLHTMFPATLGDAVAARFESMHDLEQEEQYLDFLRLRPFRQSLLCPAAAPLRRDVDLDWLVTEPLYSALEPDEDSHEWRNPGGTRFTVRHRQTRRLLGILSNAYPVALTLKEALGDISVDRELLEELFNLFVSGGLQTTRLDNPPVPKSRPVRPRVSALARVQATLGEGHLATFRHDSLGLDPVSARLVELLDGTRDLEALVEDLARAAGEDPALGRVMGIDKGTQVPRGLLRANVERLLRLFGRHGLLYGPDQP
ncbi:methyltransferase [Thioalkalivibrio denitrificans]|uniref:Methyltransferase n=1 Tax=Thioalkalivibrio denitrificans TaxID=108003 RepID=A0A1V3NEG8_9GAMM|nr:methyltransferase regulatory domain-containing protein [Thioalkalivibrio denitrificans]OOG23394.1 methyltransferase [Thioalkalivibrio denitrificans]